MKPTIRACVDQPTGDPVLGVIGEFDVYGAEAVQDILGARCAPVTAVDARFVTFIDAAGIGTLVRAADGRAMPVVASSVVARLIEICDLSSLLVPVPPTTRPAFARAPFAVLEIRDDDQIVFANESAGALLGMDVAALEGIRWTDVLTLTRMRDGLARARGRGGPAPGCTVARGHTGNEGAARPDVAWTIWRCERGTAATSVVTVTDLPTTFPMST